MTSIHVSSYAQGCGGSTDSPPAPVPAKNPEPVIDTYKLESVIEHEESKPAPAAEEEQELAPVPEVAEEVDPAAAPASVPAAEE